MCNSFAARIRRHWPALVLALIVGTLIIAPSWYFRYESGSYKGVDLFRSDAELNYLAQIQETYDGYFGLGNIYLADGKDAPAGIQQPLSAFIVWLFGRSFGMDAPSANLYSKFVFPALLTIVLYFLFIVLTSSRRFALLGASFVMLAPATLGLFSFPDLSSMILRGVFPNAEYQFLTYARSINPQISSFFLYGFFLLIWFALSRDRVTGKKSLNLWSSIGAAVVLGLSFHSYFFVYSFASVFTFLLFVWFIIKKDWPRARNLFFIGLGAFIIAFPALWRMYSAMSGSYYSAATERVGVFLSHKFIFSKVWWGTFFVWLASWRLQSKSVKLFFGLFLLSGFILGNQQVITGRMIPAPQHYHWYYIAPFCGAFFIYLAHRVASRYVSTRVARAGAIAALLLFAWLGVQFQRASYAHYAPLVISEQRYSGALAWLRENASRDSAVLASDEAAHLVVGFTPANVYYHRGLTDFPIPPERMKSALFINIFLSGVTAESASEYFEKERNLVGSWLYGEHYRQRNGCNGCFPDELRDALIKEYQEFLSRDFVTELKKYPLDYILWDRESEPEWRVERWFKDKVFDDGRVAIYRV